MAKTVILQLQSLKREGHGGRQTHREFLLVEPALHSETPSQNTKMREEGNRKKNHSYRSWCGRKATSEEVDVENLGEPWKESCFQLGMTACAAIPGPQEVKAGSQIRSQTGQLSEALS